MRHPIATLLMLALLAGCVSLNPYPRKDLAADQIQAIDQAFAKLPRPRKK